MARITSGHGRRTARSGATCGRRRWSATGGGRTACGKAGRLEVHHVKPVHLGGTNAIGNLMVLCRGCHIAAHKREMSDTERAWQVMVHEVSA